MQLSTELKYEISQRPLKTILRSQSSYVNDQYTHMPKSKPYRTTLKIPNTFDGSKIWANLISPVINQGQCGSCWAIASCSTLSDRFNIQSLGQLDVFLSPAKLILCDFGGKEFNVKHPELTPEALGKVDKMNLQASACYGNTLYDAWRYLYVIGTNTENCVPFDKFLGYTKKKYNQIGNFSDPTKLPLCSELYGKIGDLCYNSYYDDKTGEEIGEPARFYRALHFYAIAGVEKDGGNEAFIRHNIYLWGPVSTGMEVYPDFYTFDPKTEIYEWNGKGPLVSGHAIELLGWGMEVNKDGQKKDYWLVKNSWGKDWGVGGYFKMARGINCCKMEENVITGVPDFFYPLNYKLIPKVDVWLENKKAISERKQIDYKINISGGGIDPESGYVRRTLITKPWVKNSRILDLQKLPNWDTFIAGTDASYKSLHPIRSRLGIIILIFFIIIVVLIWICFYK